MLMLFVAENINASRKGVEGNFEKKGQLCQASNVLMKKTMKGADASIPPDTISPVAPAADQQIKIKKC